MKENGTFRIQPVRSEPGEKPERSEKFGEDSERTKVRISPRKTWSPNRWSARAAANRTRWKSRRTHRGS